MDLRDELTRQGLLLEFISDCVGLQSVPDLANLITARLHWICDHDTCTALLPDGQGLLLRSQDRRSAGAGRIEDDALLARHRSALDEAMRKGAPVTAHHEGSDMFLIALPFGSATAVHGALCLARAASRFSHGDMRHLRHACNTVGGALERMGALAAERAAEYIVKLAESELRSAAEDRVLLAEQMVGIVSHDLRNPLSAILMGATLIGMGEPLPAQKERILQKVQGAARRAQRLVDELLDFTQARVGKGLVLKMAELDLDQLMTSIADELRLSFPNVELHRPGGPPETAYLDADRIHQLLGNLAANAAMYGTPGKPIRLRYGIVAGELVLSVSNEGKAIPKALLATMFELMIRGQGHGGGQHGVGLGLYIVRAIAEGHHGTVDVTSSVEDGTCFSVRIPADCRESS